jgi:hypothetical protein
MRHRPYRLLLAAATVAAYVASAPAASAAPILDTRCAVPAVVSAAPVGDVYVDVGTGEQNGVKDNIPDPDTKWHVQPYAAAYSVTPNAAWTTVPNANWINSRTTNASSGGTQASTTFRTQFWLTPEVVARTLNLEYAADNGVKFYLNGQLIGGYDPPTTAPVPQQLAAFTTLHPLAYAGLFFQDGVNNLDAVVTDYGVSTGLLVRGTFHGCLNRTKVPSTCVEVTKAGVISYSPAPVDLGTGEQGYTPDAPGAVDTKWTSTLPTAGPAYSVAPYAGWYDDPGRTSNWINNSPDPYTNGVPLTRTYRMQFTAPTYAYGGIDLAFAADNDVVIRLNGVVVGQTTGSPGSFNQLHTVSLAGAPIHGGTNTLEATVTDYGVVTGLYVEGSAYVCPGVRVVDGGTGVEAVDEVLHG